MADRRSAAAGITRTELLIAAVLLAAGAAVAVPRLGRAASPGPEAQLETALANVRNALRLYAAEHGGRFPGPDAAGMLAQLATYTDRHGRPGTRDDARHAYRRYLVGLPPCPVGENAGTAAASGVHISQTSPPLPDPAAGAGWLYNPATGEFCANTRLRDGRGRPYCEY